VILRRHDRYYLRQYLAALGAAVGFLAVLVIVFDLANRLDDIPKVAPALRASGRTVGGALVEYYATLIPFIATKLLPFATLIAAGMTFTWLARSNELAPIVTAGVPSARVLAPVIATAVLLAGLQTLARETVIPALSRRHDDLHRMISRRGRADRLTDVPHLFDERGGRVSMVAYGPNARTMESAWVTFREPDADAAATRYVALHYPVLAWDEADGAWVALRGGTRCVLEPTESGANTVAIAAGEKAPLSMRPALVELTVRQSAALGFSSAELSVLAEGYPDNPRFRLVLHQQWAAPAAIVIALLLGLPFVFHLGRGRVFFSFGTTVAIVAAYHVADTVLTDLGTRGALNPIVAAWGAHVLFGALGVVLMTTVET
jgi:lipopolysaccharide export system permease protein